MRSLLYRKGDQFYAPGFEVYADQRTIGPGSDQVHWHDYCEVELVLRGSGRHELNHRDYALNENSLYLITPMDFHAVQVDPACELALYHVQFGYSVIDSEMMRRITRAREGRTPGIAVRLQEPLGTQVRRIFEEMIDEYQFKRRDGMIMLRACLERLCVLTLREAEREEKRPPDMPQAEENAVINQAIQYIQYNFRNSLTLSDVAREVHLSNNYFGELFGGSLGMTFNQYLRKQRLAYACRLLAETELDISEIARESGFKSLSYFSEVFRTQYGEVPTQYRRKKQQEGENR